MSRKEKWLRMGLAFVMGVIVTLGTIVGLVCGMMGNVVGAADFFRTLSAVRYNYVEDVDTARLWQGAIGGMVDALGDPHSVYLDEQMYDAFLSETTGSFSGVGLVVGKKDDHLIVIAPIEGTPGDLAGVKSGDVILAIDGEDTTNLNLTEAVGKIRGVKNTSVTLTIRRGDAVQDYEIVRENIKVHSVKGKMLDDSIGYIRITNFNESVADDLKEEYTRLESEGMKRIVLDLRDNPGGLLDKSVEVAELFVKEGPVVSIVERDGSRTTFSSQGGGSPYPFVVLVNHGSASASEIVAGAVQDTESGILIGSQTYGKGSVQTMVPLLNGAVKLTIAKYYTPNEQIIDGVGITPNIIVEADELTSEDKTLNAAIEYLKTK